jgi:hypothetical protein
MYLSLHLTLKIERFANTVQLNGLYGSQINHTALINSIVFITREESVYCAVRTEPLIIIQRKLCKKGHVMTQ